ncbi:polysaccharide biosynthesis C-terminal domain-containing protein [Adhaeribacter swui]|uniref:Polysaccharide biosynthesis C-terminal domain-containing protein n=1 Tax=Adhaeribacter swui TaxID=2086471 RepID=A0A7G7G3G4_9BACT|nr:polysaccharide biosynthesis C-terminal domain-containing protein [Adhaeribacter swui]QNF31698.1 polysaccharide biosynthesis C-terminal domain-containing protein [Adhaeribacter swui]
MSIAKKLVGQTAAYGLSSIIGRTLNFLLFPLYLGIFAPEDYGVINGLYAYVGFFNILFAFGLETAFFRYANQPGADRQQLFNRVLSFIIFSSVLLTACILLFIDPISRAIKFPDQQLFISWLAIILAVDAIVNIPFARLRLENKAAKFAGIKMLNVLITVAANVFIYWFCYNVYQENFLVGLKPLISKIYFPEWKLGYIFLINLVANLLLIPLLWREFRSFKFSLDFAFMKPLLQYGYPIMLMGFAGIVNELLDRILLLELLPPGFYPDLTSKGALGVYGGCYKIATFMTLAIQAFRYAGEPFFFSQAKERNSAQTFALVTKWFVIVCAFIFLFISANLDDLKFLLRRPSYYQGMSVIPVLLLANLFLGVYYNLSTWFKLTDKTYYGTFISFGGAAITIILNIVLIPVLGYMGCAYATLACYFSMAAACYYFGQKHYPIPYPVATMAGYLALAIGLVYIAQHFVIEDFVWRHLFHLGLCGLYLIVLYIIEKPTFAVSR